jgi:aspartyl protease family protein
MKNICFVFICLICYVSSSQQLNIQETLNYIESIENEYRKEWSESVVKYTFDQEGILVQDEYRLTDIDKLYKSTSVHIDDIILKVNIEDWDDNDISIKCKNKNCFSYTQFIKGKSKTSYKDHSDTWGKWEFVVRQEYQAKKMINAINYLFSLLKNEKYLRDADDPFAISITTSGSSESKSKEVKLNESNGTFIIDVNFGNLKIPFVLDSGAAEIAISSNVEKQLLSNGTMTKRDYLSDGLYKLADGRIVTQRRVLLKNVTVGEFTVRNVPASIGGQNTPLLLGKNFLDKFKSWSINNSKKTLELRI